MFDLFKAELFRFRYWTLAYFLAHGAVIAFYARLADLLQAGPMIVQGVTAVYCLSALLLGLYQMGGYRRANRWLNLIHRPLKPHRIALALVGAALVVIAVGIVLPFTLMLTVQELFSARVVDLRHWLLPLAILLVAGAGYLAGAYTILGVRRYAPLVLVLPALLGFSNAAGLGAVAVQALVFAWLLYLVMSAFKPDLTQVPKRLHELAATALPVQMAVFLLIMAVGGIAFQLGWIMLGTHPLNSVPPKGGFVEASRAEGRDIIAAALEGRSGPQARLWREQAKISDTFKIQPAFDQLPVRGELTNTVPVEFADGERKIVWTFSHDSMRFEGRRSIGGARHGSLGLGESNQPFDRPPVSAGEGTLVDARSIAAFDGELELILPRLQVPPGETIAAAPVPIGQSVGLLTDKAVYFYDSEVLQADDQEFPARQRVPLRRKIGNLERIDVMELLDGYLVSQVFGRGAPEGQGEPFQHLLYVGGSDAVVELAGRTLSHDFPALSRFQPLWLSPVLSKAYDGAVGLFAPPTPLAEHDPSPAPGFVWIVFLCLAFVSAIGTWLWSGRVGHGRNARIGWTAASAAIGLPALISLLLFHPRRPARPAR